MRPRYTLWLKTAIVFMFLTGAVHAVSLVASPQPRTDTERQLMELMQTYRLDMGDGFHPTMANLMTALSACFTFVCVLGGWINAYLIRRRVATDVLKGVVGIHVLVFGAVFAVMLALTFSPPIVLTGLIVVFLLLAYFTIPAERKTV
jgi:hypothetical protein